MRQILQSLRTGATQLAEVPSPGPASGQVVIRSVRSLVSAGTERMLVEFGRAGWVGKARQQPDKVRTVLDKMASDGIAPTVSAVFSKLDQPLPLGYCNVGEVLEAAGGFVPGERVASNAHHAEIVSVAANLCARIPDAVSDDEAAFTVPGAIALQAIRLAQPALGESVVVIGLGLIGQLCVQLLGAHGCRVLGVDLSAERLALARRFGAEVAEASGDPVAAALAFSRARGVDAVIVAAATNSSEPLHQAALMCRKRGRIVLVGVAGLELRRADFYEKELSFQVSCSYGPGRYDPAYEQQGIDYPVGFVRWTAQRNFEAVLDMMASKRLDVLPLVSHRFPLEGVVEGYELLTRPDVPSLGILIDYPATTAVAERVTRRSIELPASAPRAAAAGQPRVAFIGAGNHAGRVLIPAFAAAGCRLTGIASNSGVTAAHYGRKFGFARATTDAEALCAADDVDAVVIATRHDSHARFVVAALEAGKDVFVEKPLALTAAELDAIAGAWAAGRSAGNAPRLMVGFNRRFAPQVVRMRALLAAAPEPKSIIITVNAGAVPASHWVHDPQQGGGRLVGEGCHFIDLARFLVGQPITEARVRTLSAASLPARDENVAVTLAFADGSWSTIHYLANGHAALSKERLEVFCSGRVLQLDNFRRLQGYGWPQLRTWKLWRQDKGVRACAQAFVAALSSGGPSPIPFDELLEVSRVTLDVGEAARG